jgi:hypothetical protein
MVRPTPTSKYPLPELAKPTEKDARWPSIDPVGTLDLDTTVTMCVALTSEPRAGHVRLQKEGLWHLSRIASPGLTVDLESVVSTCGNKMSIGDRTDVYRLLGGAKPES